MSTSLHSALSSPISAPSFIQREKKFVFAGRSSNNRLDFKPLRFNFPLICAATNFSLSLDTGSSVELDAVTSYSEIVPDTVIFDDFERFPPTAATVSCSLISGICSLPGNRFRSAVDTALADSECCHLEKSNDRTSCFIDKALVNVGGRLAKLVPGRVSTEIDVRVAYDTAGTVEKVHHLLKLYGEIGVSPQQVLFRIPATWQGIEASRLLESQGIQTHVTFVYSFCQAAAAAQAGASVIQIYVGRLRDWARNHSCDPEVNAAVKRGEDPALALVTKAYSYIHKFGHTTKVMAAAIRNKQDVFNLLGIDYIITPLKILQSLKNSVTAPDEKYSLTRRLSPQSAASYNFSKQEQVKWDQYSFTSAMGTAAVELMARGMDNYASDLVDVQQLVEKIWPPPNV